ncbi:MAG TPA: hypothetical protein DIT99_10170 [Candidatus Latescibacteria bacterium]|nr:hypothetical protein [Candidatus Latescibacterota bacterium]
MVVGVIWDISWDGSIGKDSLFLIRSANRRVFYRIWVCWATLPSVGKTVPSLCICIPSVAFPWPPRKSFKKRGL